MKHEGVISVYGIEKDYMNYEGWEKSLEKSVKECDVILHVGVHLIPCYKTQTK